MVDIYDIGAGWASLKIGEYVFDVSYLSDLKSELDNLFKFDIHDINTIDFRANKIKSGYLFRDWSGCSF